MGAAREVGTIDVGCVGKPNCFSANMSSLVKACRGEFGRCCRDLCCCWRTCLVGETKEDFQERRGSANMTLL